MRKILFTIILYSLLGVATGFAQTVIIDEGFDDGDFTNNPTWTDPEGKHIVNASNLLQLDAPGATDEAVITTPSDAAYGEWEAFVRLDFNPSGSNLARFYIVSDTQDMKNDVSGYYIQVGDTDDEVSLYRQDGGGSTKIIDGTDGIVDSTPVNVRVRVTRDLDGNWELFADATGGSSFTSQGTTTDNTYQSSQFIGFFSDYTSTRSDLFEYDDIVVTKITPPLAIQDVTLQDNSTIDVQFNLDIDPASVDAADFSVDNSVGSPNSTSLPSSNTVRLSYNNPLPNDQYTLTINNIDDTDGNTINPNATALFTIFGNFAPGDVIINEFVYDPPSGQVEYVEIKNTSGKLLNLQDWQIGDNDNNGTISSNNVVLQPNGFIVVSSDTSALFNVYGSRSYIESSSIPTFNNDDDAIKIITDTGTLADSLYYTSAWGGIDIALERRSDTAPSTFMENFGDSPNPNGGTPGITNEIPDDTTPPDLDNLIITNDQTLDLDFSERLQNGPVANTANYSLDNGISVNNAQQTAGDSVRLSLSSPLQDGTEYQLTINNQQDIFSNTAASIDTTFSFFVVTPADSGDIFINEFTKDPPSGSTEYIELYNPTNESFDLNGWTLNDNNGNPQTITNSPFIVPPDSFVVIAPDQTLLQDNPDIALVTMGSNFPGLNNGSDDIVLRDDTGERLDSLRYTPNWGGEQVALERRTTTVAPIQANFGEAPNGFGTPGRENQIPEDTTPPDIEDFVILNNQSLQFVYTEQVEEQSATNTANYSLTNGISVNNVTLSGGDTVRVNLSGSLQNNTEYTATIDGVEDLFGNTLTNRDTTFTYYEVSPADSGDVFLNEFTYDPPEGSTEYIELYNSSAKSLDLQNWTVNDNTGNTQSITNSQFVVPPNSFVVLAPDQTLLQDNPDIALVAMGSRFPALNNSGDDIVLRDDTGERLDSLRYTSAWGGEQVALERRTVNVDPIEANFGDSPNGFGTPGRQNEIGQDNTPPDIQAFSIRNDQLLEFVFTEQVESQSATNAANYSLSNGISVSNVTLSSGDTVRVNLSGSLQNNTEYTATIDGVEDLFGNTLTNRDTTFTYFETSPADSGDIFLNEFTYDPPEGSTEYIELYNTSSKSLDLQNWTVNDNTGNRRTITESQRIVPPNSFVVLAPDQTLLQDNPDIALVAMGSRFPALNNNGDDIVLRDETGAKLDSLSFTSNWGGEQIALERRTTAVAPIQANFGEAPNGFGTPGDQNEVGQDTTPPDLANLFIPDNQTLKLAFSEGLDEGPATNAGNYTLNNGISVNSAQQIAPDSVQLGLSSPLQDATEYQLTIENQQDIFGNTAASIDTSFTYFEPSPADSGDVFLNEFTFDPPEGSTEYIELYNTSPKSLDLQNWTVNDNTGNRQTITDGQRIVPPNSFVVIAPDQTLLNDNPGILLVSMGSDFPALNNSGDDIVLRDDTGERLDSLSYTSDWGGNEVALERRTTSAPPVQANFGEAPSGFGTPGRENQIPEDTTPPDIKDFVILNNQSLQFVYTEQVEEQSATNTANYSLTNGIAVNNVSLSGGDTVRVNLSGSLQNNTEYTATIDGVEDLFGNTLTNRDTTFTYFETSPADSGDIFLNEFTYDPPEGSTEYIELYNTSSKSLDLQNWTINDNTGNRQTITDGQRIVPPNSFVILAPDQTLLQDNSGIALVAMGSRFPSLNNSGDDIVLRDETGERLDSLSYTSGWGGNEVALERRTTNALPVQANFGDSPNGSGTPGDQNEIGQDNIPPDLIGLEIPDSQTLTLAFSEGLDEGTATDPGTYTLDNGITISAAQQTTRDSVFLSLGSPLQNGTEYQLSINNQQDIFGNTAAATDTSFTFFEVSVADSGEIFINEFTFDPPTGSVEYVELINTTSQSFDLNGWTLNDNTGNRQLITNSRAIVPPNSFIVIAPDQTLRNDFPDINLVTMGSRFPSLNNSGDDIVLRRADGTRLDSLTYTSAFGDNNVAVERRTTDVPPIQVNFGDSPNGFGTPGSPNEIPPDNQPPIFENLQILDQTTLRLTFSEPITSQTAIDQANYTIMPGRNIQLISSVQDTVTLFLSQDLESGETYQVTVQNLQDVFGNTMQETTLSEDFLQISDAQPGDIIINEILYSRASAGSPEFVELLNLSDKNFNLSGWQIGDASDEATISSGTQLRAGEYLVITDNASLANLLNESGLFLSNFPSLNDDEDAVYIQTDGGITVDSLFYNANFGGAIDGRSSERIDPGGASNDPANFMTSQDEEGNTPAEQNSVFRLDEDSPEIVFSRIFPNGDIEVRFSEFISLTPNLTFTLADQPLTVDSFDPSKGDVIFLNTPSGTTPGSDLTITAENLSDVKGNVTASTQLAVSQPLNPSDVVINEILFDPLSDSDDNQPDQSEYIELRNTRDYAISLENISFHDAPDEDGEVRTLTPVSTNSKFIPAQGTALVYAEDETSVFEESKVARFFNLQNTPSNTIRIDRSTLSLASTDDAIYLTGNNGMEIDSVFYDETWHNPNLVTTDGVALERINPFGPSNNDSNWGSSTAESGGTPNQENTLFQAPGNGGQQDIGISFNPNPFSPDDDGIDDNLFINYKLDQPDYLMTVRIYDRYGRLVRKLADGEQAGFEGTLIWDGLKDNGNRNRIGFYIIIFKAFDSASGNNRTFKETVVLARQLN